MPTAFVLRLSLAALLLAPLSCARSGGQAKNKNKAPDGEVEVVPYGDPNVKRPRSPQYNPRDPEVRAAPVYSRNLRGTVRALDPTGRMITVTVNARDMSFPVDDDAGIVHGSARQPAVADGLGGVPEGREVFITVYHHGDNREKVSFIRLEEAAAEDQ